VDDRDAFAFCLYCGQAGVEWHHAILRSQGGTDDANLVPLCRRCHERRHAERLSVRRDGGLVTFVDRDTGEITVRRMTPQLSTGPSVAVDEARAVQAWLADLIHGDRLSQETNEALRTLYDDLRVLKHHTWMAQAAIIHELQSRSSYGDNMAKHVADALGCSERTVQSRGRIFREIIMNPACAHACEIVQGESFYKEAVSAPDPVKAINWAAERIAGEPGYSVARFREELRLGSTESTLREIVLVCERDNPADQRIAESLRLRYRVPVRLEELAADVVDGPRVGVLHTVLGEVSGSGDIRERVAL
jgi:hypothetical protein